MSYHGNVPKTSNRFHVEYRDGNIGVPNKISIVKADKLYVTDEGYLILYKDKERVATFHTWISCIKEGFS